MGNREIAGGTVGDGMSVTTEKSGNKEYIAASEASAAASVVAAGNSVQGAASAQSASHRTRTPTSAPSMRSMPLALLCQTISAARLRSRRTRPRIATAR